MACYIYTKTTWKTLWCHWKLVPHRAGNIYEEKHDSISAARRQGVTLLRMLKFYIVRTLPLIYQRWLYMLKTESLQLRNLKLPYYSNPFTSVYRGVNVYGLWKYNFWSHILRTESDWWKVRTESDWWKIRELFHQPDSVCRICDQKKSVYMVYWAELLCLSGNIGENLPKSQTWFWPSNAT